MPVLSGTELPEVLGRFGSDVGEELHLDTAGRNASDGYVEEDDGVFSIWGPLMPLHSPIPSSPCYSARHSASASTMFRVCSKPCFKSFFNQLLFI